MDQEQNCRAEWPFLPQFLGGSSESDVGIQAIQNIGKTNEVILVLAGINLI
jgi:hypothetical protein